MKVLIHDYSGHPFQVQLSRELAGRGYNVLHMYSADFQTPKGDLVLRSDDPPTLRIKALTIGESFQKSTFLKRRSQEVRYGHILANLIREERPDIVFSSNTPLDPQRLAQAATFEISGTAFVFWLQDIYGKAIYDILLEKLWLFGAAVGIYYKKLELALLKASNHVVCITQDFVDILEKSGVERTRVSVIENWAPLKDIPLVSRENAFAVAHGMVDSKNIVYSGTLGYKHNPDLLLRLAEEVSADVHVFSEGPAAVYLAEKAKEKDLPNLKVRSWVAFEDLPSMLAAADVAVTLIETEAGSYSVPSKVLTYLAAGRPILASIPSQNLAARIIEREQTGVVVSPHTSDDFVAGARKLLADDERRLKMGSNARAYAQKHFDIKLLGDRFEKIIVETTKALANQNRHNRPQ